MFDVKKIKKDFPIFENYKRETGRDLVFLDSAASSQTPKVVVDAMDDYYFKYRSNIHRSAYNIGEQATNSYEDARKTAAEFINADTNEIIFTNGATDSSNMLIYALEKKIEWKEGDEVVTTILEHHSNLLPLQEMAKRNGVKFRHFEMAPDFNIDYGNLDGLINEKTRIVSMTLASNVTGAITDVKRVSEAAHKRGAIVIVDATKAAGHMLVDVKSLDCDFLFFSGHKICGPTGIGILYGKYDILNKMPTSSFGGGTVEDVTMEEAKYSDAPFRFEAGTPNIAGVIGLGAAIKYLEAVGVENARKHTQDLVAYAIKKLSTISGVKIICERDHLKNIGIVSFVVDGVHPHDVGEILNRHHVAVRGGHHCAIPLMKALGVSAISRASFYIYNEESDIDALAEGIEEAIKIFS
ncbi:MAG: cysteine desulfurase [Candidatus Paceibacterota bacterium]|jgi:cysteine desulfurase/selenocysteine lyase